jgi:hypothetical protein
MHLDILSRRRGRACQGPPATSHRKPRRATDERINPYHNSIHVESCLAFKQEGLSTCQPSLQPTKF